MKKFIICCLFLIMECQTSGAFVYHDEFYKKLETCTPYNKNVIGSPIIYGREKSNCHVSFPNTTVSNTELNRSVKLDNCYIPMSQIRKYSQLSKQVSEFVKKELLEGIVPPDSAKKVFSEKFEYEETYCK